MTTQHEDFSARPFRVCEERWDAIWVVLPKDETARPFANTLLQHLDWRMVGQLSRWWMDEKKNQTLTFIPSLKRIASPCLVVSKGSESVKEEASEVIRGGQYKRVLFISEEKEAQGAMKTALDKLKSDAESLQIAVLG